MARIIDNRIEKFSNGETKIPLEIVAIHPPNGQNVLATDFHWYKSRGKSKEI